MSTQLASRRLPLSPSPAEIKTLSSATPSAKKLGLPSYEYSSAKVNKALNNLGVTVYQLTRLLGRTDASLVYHWKNMTYRPKEIFAERINQLLEWHYEGYPINQMKSINWETGEVEWRKYVPDKNDSIGTNRPGTINIRRDNKGMAPRPPQRQRQDGYDSNPGLQGGWQAGKGEVFGAASNDGPSAPRSLPKIDSGGIRGR